MSSGDRFYQLELRHRPALHGDVGSLLKIEGLVIGGEGAQAILMLPDTSLDYQGVKFYHLTPEEWTDWLQRSDQPEILVSGSLEKAFHRKTRYDISGAVQQKVWVADGLKCMYCGAPFGKAAMSIDHFNSLESGGVNDTSNYLSCCKKCNKNKGSMDARSWCDANGLSFDFYVDYLSNRRLP